MDFWVGIIWWLVCIVLLMRVCIRFDLFYLKCFRVGLVWSCWSCFWRYCFWLVLNCMDSCVLSMGLFDMCDE